MTRGSQTGTKTLRSSTPINPKMDLTSHTVFRLIVLHNFITRPFTIEIGRAHGLALTDWRVLFIVGGRPGISSAEMVDQFGFEKMAVSRSITRLEAGRRLTREVDVHDRRRASLRLTPDGEAFLRQETPRALSREAILDRSLTPDEQRELDRMLDKIIDTLRK